jgi:large-conductance mechanosensitive channel
MSHGVEQVKSCVRTCDNDPTRNGLIGFVFESTTTSSFIFAILVSRILNIITEMVFNSIGFGLSSPGQNRKFSDFFYSLNGGSYASREAANLVGAPLVTYGWFIQTFVEIIFTALFLFMMIRIHRSWYKEKGR